MPKRVNDPRPRWNYPFPLPAANLGVGDFAVMPPGLVKAEGVDGRWVGTARRFPGFRVVRELVNPTSQAFNNIERCWSVNIQKGMSPYQLRGFVVLADSHTNASHKGVYANLYDTETSAWLTTNTLIDFAATNPYQGSRTLGSLHGLLTTVVVATAGESGCCWQPTSRKFLVWYPISVGVTQLVEIDPVSGAVLKKIGTRPYQCLGGTWQATAAKIYIAVNAGTPENYHLITTPDSFASATDEGVFKEGATPRDVVDLAWDATGGVLYGISKGAAAGGVQALFTVDISGADAALTRVGLLQGITTPHSLWWDDDAGKLYMLADTTVYEVNTSSAALTAKATGVTSDLRLEHMPSAGGFFHGLSLSTMGYGEVAIDASPYSFEGVDVTSTWRYFYLVCAATGQRAPYNRAFFWDENTGALVGRTAGWKHPVLPGTLLTVTDSADGVIANGKRVSVATRLRSPRHGLISPLSPIQQITTDAAGGNPDYVNVSIAAAAANLPTDIPAVDLSLEVYRSIGIDAAISSADRPLVGNLYLDLPKEDATGGAKLAGYATSETSAAKSDAELTARTLHQFTTDYVGSFPRSTRIIGLDRQLVIVAAPFQGNDIFTDAVELLDKAAERVMWSPPEKFDLENFRGGITGEMYRPADVGKKIQTIRKAGDFVVVVGERGIVRLHKSGPYMAANPMTAEWGIESRDGIAVFEEMAYFATAQGLFQANLRSMQVSTIGAFRKVLVSPEYWRNKLATVVMAYDAQLGALMLLQTDTDEMYLLWPESGGVTSLVDCPFVHGWSGIHPEDGGAQRSFWVTVSGLVLTPDAEETETRKTMCGVTTTETVNGTASADGAGDGTTLIDTTGTFNNTRMKGFYLYMLSGTNAGEKRTITGISGTTITVAAFSNQIKLGDRYAIAPIPFTIRGWQLLDAKGTPDPRGTKVLGQMGAIVRLIAGDTGSANAQMTYNAYQRFSTTPDVTATVDLDENPDLMVAQLADGIAGPLIYPEWKCLCSDLDLELLLGLVDGRIKASDAES